VSNASSTSKQTEHRASWFSLATFRCKMRSLSQGMAGTAMRRPKQNNPILFWIAFRRVGWDWANFTQTQTTNEDAQDRRGLCPNNLTQWHQEGSDGGCHPMKYPRYYLIRRSKITSASQTCPGNGRSAARQSGCW